MKLEGELAIRLRFDGAHVRDVAIDSTRPHVADRLLAGRPVDEAVALVPRLFAICGRAQGIAAQLAAEAARGADSGPMAAARTRAIEAEIAQEYLWRALIDWPQAVDREPDTEALAAVRAALAADAAPSSGAVREVIETRVLGGDAEDWVASHVPAFEMWIARAPTAAAQFAAAVQRDGPRHGAGGTPLLPPMNASNAARFAAALDADAAFERLPQLDGRPAETGAIARMQSAPLVAALAAAYGRSILVRFVARIAELARLASGRPAPLALLGRATCGPGRGLGWVETARGLLVHTVELDGDLVRRYRIVAPTEWNFHPRGAFAAGLAGAYAASEIDLRRRAHWLAQSLDPCVAYRVEIADA
ncbi:MAG: nickel-dependent hydrogenase large subunit [Pseudomonadota bacterium]